MKCVSPDGPVYQAGTLSGNPVAMAAGIAQLSECAKEGFYEDQEKRTKFFVNTLNAHAKQKGYLFEVFTIGSVFWLAFSDKLAIRRADEIDGDMTSFKDLFAALLEEGIYIGPSGYEVGFISTAHTMEILTDAAEKFCRAMDKAFTK